MQKVAGSNPISRFEGKTCKPWVFLSPGARAEWDSAFLLSHGNKRVALIAMRGLLARTAEMIERLASREVDEEDFAAWVEDHIG